MGNDNEIIHKEVMMFLGDEVKNIHQNADSQTYNIEEEYAKSRKNHSVFSIVLLTSSLLVIVAVALIMTRMISSRNQDISIGLQEFDDLNLKNLLSSVSAAQTNYDSALKTLEKIDADYASAVKNAQNARDNEIFVLDSLHLDSKTDYDARLRQINRRFDAMLRELEEDYSQRREAANEDAEMFRLALGKFDQSAIDNARDSAGLDSESQLHRLEMKKLEDQYERRILELETALATQREKNQEDMRLAINQVVEKYQAEIDRLDPKLRPLDPEGYAIIDGKKSDDNTADFNGGAALARKNISEARFVSRVSDYQEKYNQYKYLDDKIAGIPQKYSIPEYVATARKLVNEMAQSYLNTTVEFYQEKTALNNEITALNNEIKDYRRQIAAQRSLYEQNMDNMLAALKSGAAVLSAKGFGSIQVYVVPQFRQMIVDSGTEGIPAEFRADKLTVKGRVVADGTDADYGTQKFRFIVSEDKDGSLPKIDFSFVTPGLTIRLQTK